MCSVRSPTIRPLKKGGLGLALTLVLLASACAPARSNPHDQKRCLPACGAHQWCLAGRCLARDIGADLARDGGAPDTGLRCVKCGVACLATCGDGTCSENESCLDCPLDCACPPGCGNGVREPGEACDDGNARDDDLCSNACKLQRVRVDTAAQADRLSVAPVLGLADDGALTVLWTRRRAASELGTLRLRRLGRPGVPIDAAEIEVTSVPAFATRALTVMPASPGEQRLFWHQGVALWRGGLVNECVPRLLQQQDMSTERQATSLVRLGRGEVVEVWSSDKLQSKDDSGLAVYRRRWAGDGQSLDSGPQLVNTSFAGDQSVTRSAVAALDQGGFVIAWTDGQADGVDEGVRARVFKADGSPAGPGAEFALNQLTRGSQRGVVVASLARIGFVAVWQDDSSVVPQVRFRRFTHQGVALDASELLASTATERAAPLGVVGNRRGEFLVLWQETADCLSGCPNEQAWARLFDATGRPLSPNLRLAGRTAGYSTAAALALPSGDFVVACSEGPGPSETPPVDLYLSLIPR